MKEKYREAWRWFLTVHSIYLAIYIFLQVANRFPSAFFWILIAAGNIFAIFSTFQLIENKRNPSGRLVRLIIFGIYILFVTFNTLIFSVLMLSDFWSYFSKIAEFLLDMIGLVFPIIALYPITKVFTNIGLNKKNLLTYLWTGYLWSIWIILGLAFGMTMLDIQKWIIYDYFLNTSVVLLLIGIFSYYYKKEIFPRIYWKVYFWISISWNIMDLVYNFTGLKEYLIFPDYLKSHAPEIEYPLVVYLILSALFFPLYIPLYKISFDKNFFKKKLMP